MVALHRIEKMVSEYFSELYVCAKSIAAALTGRYFQCNVFGRYNVVQ